MNIPAIRCVVDASVAIKLFVEQPQSDVATELFAQLGADPPATLYVPGLFYAECANVLWQIRPQGSLSDDRSPTERRKARVTDNDLNT